MQISKGILTWLVISSLVVYIDGFFVLNRPETMNGGRYYSFYKPYDLYLQFDQLYAALDNLFVYIIAWLNVVESTLCLFGVLIYFSSKRIIGALICLVASVMVFWKTVLYMWYDRDWLSPEALNFSGQSIALYYLPNAFWLVFPFLAIKQISQKIIMQEKMKKE